MPVPGGEITTTELWQAPVEEVVEEVVEDSITEEELVQDDLPELS
jgi:hypothetical protein